MAAYFCDTHTRPSDRSGRTVLKDKHSVKPKLRLRLGLSPQLPPQWRDCQHEPHAATHFRLLRMLLATIDRCLVRRGILIPAALSSSCGNTPPTGFLRSTRVRRAARLRVPKDFRRLRKSADRFLLAARLTSLPRYDEPLRLPIPPRDGDGFPSPVERPATTDRSRNRVSHVPVESFGARCPLSPRRVPPLPLFVASQSSHRLHPIWRAGHSHFASRSRIGPPETTRTLSHDG